MRVLFSAVEPLVDVKARNPKLAAKKRLSLRRTDEEELALFNFNCPYNDRFCR